MRQVQPTADITFCLLKKGKPHILGVNILAPRFLALPAGFGGRHGLAATPRTLGKPVAPPKDFAFQWTVHKSSSMEQLKQKCNGHQSNCR